MNDPNSATLELAETLDFPDPPLDRSLLLLSEALQATSGIVEPGLQELDEISKNVALGANRPPNLADVVHTLFGNYHFAGDVENYHDEQNSFLDLVLTRRLGMPITLSAVVTAVGARVGLELRLVGLPGHVVVGQLDEYGHFGSFVDAFSGSTVDRPALSQRLTSIFGRSIEVTDSMLVPMTTLSVISRVCNNLTRTWAPTPAKLDRLLEFRSRIPQSKTDQENLANIAEAQGRFDIAARMRESLDPDDPSIDHLWGKLN